MNNQYIQGQKVSIGKRVTVELSQSVLVFKTGVCLLENLFVYLKACEPGTYVPLLLKIT